MRSAKNLIAQSLLGLFVCGSPAFGSVIATRTSLNSLLAPGATTEDFENLTVDANDQWDPDAETELDSTTTATIYGTPAGGPGLVQPGVQYISSQQIGWNGDGYYGLSTNTLFSNSSDSTLEVLFTGTVNAFGLDLLAFDGYGDTANVAVLGADGTTVIFNSADLTLSGPTAPLFFGYQDAAGIGGAYITQQNNPWSPVIDNLTFGQTSAPEPGAATLAGLGIGLLLLPIFTRNSRKKSAK